MKNRFYGDKRLYKVRAFRCHKTSDRAIYWDQLVLDG
jgi:hypothetical protein